MATTTTTPTALQRKRLTPAAMQTSNRKTAQQSDQHHPPTHQPAATCHHQQADARASIEQEADTKTNSKMSTNTTRGQRCHASYQQLTTTAAANLCMAIHSAFTAREEHDSTSSSAPLLHYNRSSATIPTAHAHQATGETPPPQPSHAHHHPASRRTCQCRHSTPSAHSTSAAMARERFGAAPETPSCDSRAHAQISYE